MPLINTILLLLSFSSCAVEIFKIDLTASELILTDAWEERIPMIRYETHLPLINSEKPFKEHSARRQVGDNFIVNWHQSLELIYVVEGDIEVITNDVSVRCAPGELAVINSSYLHDIIPHTSSEYYCIIINIDFLTNFGIKIDEVEFDRLVRSPKVCDLCLRIKEVCENRGENYELLAKADILTLVAELFVRHSKPRDEHGRVETGRFDGARDIIKYLQEHFSERLSLNDISDAVGYNKYYISHVFKSVAGVTVMTYLNMLRAYHARELLKSKKHTVGEVCRMCGFDNLSYFSRTYKKYVGILPSKEGEKRKVQLTPPNAEDVCITAEAGCGGCY